MTGFNYLMLAFAAGAALLFVVLLAMLAKRTKGQGGFELPDPGPGSIPVPIPAPAYDQSIAPPPATPPFPDAPPYAAWCLVSRTLANPDSAGGPLYRLRFAPDAALPLWQAGAIARVYCGPAEDVLTPGGAPTAPAGDYMIGSLPPEGTVDLVVRVRSNQGDDDGRRSQWLSQDLQPGQSVALALRDNPAFGPPADDKPLILIGNATGVAGLEAHIKARPAGSRNWLILGDRGSADDKILAAEITEWVSIGHLERCDLVLPGEGPEQRRITDQLADAGDTLLDWGLAGATIYVCGSVPMGNDVHTALAGRLGGEVLEAMAEGGLYRHMVF